MASTEAITNTGPARAGRIDRGLARMKERWANLRRSLNTPGFIAQPSAENIGPVAFHADELARREEQSSANMAAPEARSKEAADQAFREKYNTTIDMGFVSNEFRQALNDGESIIPSRMSESDKAKYPGVDTARRDHVFDAATNIKVVEWKNNNGEVKSGYAVTRMNADNKPELVVYTLDQSGHFKPNGQDWIIAGGNNRFNSTDVAVAPSVEEWKNGASEPVTILGGRATGVTGETDEAKAAAITKVYEWPKSANEDITKIIHRDVAVGSDGDSLNGMPIVEVEDVTHAKKKGPSPLAEPMIDPVKSVSDRLMSKYVADPAQFTAEIAQDRAEQQEVENSRAAAKQTRSEIAIRAAATRKDNKQLTDISAQQVDREDMVEQQDQDEALLREAEKADEKARIDAARIEAQNAVAISDPKVIQDELRYGDANALSQPVDENARKLSEQLAQAAADKKAVADKIKAEEEARLKQVHGTLKTFRN